MRSAGLVAVVLAVSATLVGTSPASGAGSSGDAATGTAHRARTVARTVALWKMDESRGAGVMKDSSGHGISGRIGSAVQTHVKVGGATAYRWTHVAPNQAPAKPERLVLAQDKRLNPWRGSYAVTIRFRTTHSAGNMIQKGQAGARGGYWKFQNVRGKITCLFRGRSASGDVLSRPVNSGAKALDDGKWHTVTCRRTAKRLTMTIDGSRTRRAVGRTGRIANSRPVSIGGKSHCDQKKITCDYFSGDIDYVRIER